MTTATMANFPLWPIVVNAAVVWFGHTNRTVDIFITEHFPPFRSADLLLLPKQLCISENLNVGIKCAKIDTLNCVHSI